MPDSVRVGYLPGGRGVGAVFRAVAGDLVRTLSLGRAVAGCLGRSLSMTKPLGRDLPAAKTLGLGLGLATVPRSLRESAAPAPPGCLREPAVPGDLVPGCLRRLRRALRLALGLNRRLCLERRLRLNRRLRLGRRRIGLRRRPGRRQRRPTAPLLFVHAGRGTRSGTVRGNGPGARRTHVAPSATPRALGATRAPGTASSSGPPCFKRTRPYTRSRLRRPPTLGPSLDRSSPRRLGISPSRSTARPAATHRPGQPRRPTRTEPMRSTTTGTT